MDLLANAVGNSNLMAIQATKAGGTQTYLLNDSVMPVIIMQSPKPNGLSVNITIDPKRFLMVS